MLEPFYIKKIAVLGAGVMGAQIAAHCVNAGFETLLYDLALEDGPHNGLVNQSIANLAKLKPAPMATQQLAQLLQAKNYTDHLPDLLHCDLIIEAIGERLEWKEALYRKITPFLKDDAVLVSNTSGLSVNTLSGVLPETRRRLFCGVHFFNPPRYMHLAELIPSESTTPELLDQLETWLTRYLGKGVVRAKDTPNFVANRVGVFSLLCTLHHAEKMGLGLDEVDALTGELLGRPKSATFRTMDVVGLDTMAHVVQTMDVLLKDDPWHSMFHLPDWLHALMNAGYFGQKSGQGIYRKQGKIIEVYDLIEHQYRAAAGTVHPEVMQIMRIVNSEQRMKALIQSEQKQAQFIAGCLRDLMHYCAYHLQGIANDVRDIDLAMRWGFGWRQGPFETWQSAGVATITAWLNESIQGGQTISMAQLPEWTSAVENFYTDQGAFEPAHQAHQPRSQLPVYQRQFFRETLMGEPKPLLTSLLETQAIHLWMLEDDVAVLTFKTKANTIGLEVLEGINQALDIVERQCQGLIFYQWEAHNFSSGADLKTVFELIQSNDFQSIETMIGDFQKLVTRIKYSPVPCVAALRGRALGGGCELMMHCDAVVAAFESYPGLVEAGVGLIPAGGGCETLARRAYEQAGKSDLMVFLQPYFEQTATAFVAGNAIESLKRGYLTEKDVWVMHQNEVLYAALNHIKSMQASNYLPPLASTFQVAGREGHARLQVGLVNWLEGGFISQHDYELANQLAFVLCGGEVHEGAWVDGAWMHQLEREAFMSLVKNNLTQLRIEHLLKTGKPLRN